MWNIRIEGGNMKKIIILILLLLSFNIRIKALDYDTYYSDYRDYSDYREEEIIEDDLIDVDVEKRYRWYKEVRDGDYVKVGDDGYQYVDYSNYTLTDFSDWDNGIIDSNDDKIVETRTKYRAKKVKPINKFLIGQFDVNGGSTNVSSIKIYYEDSEIDYNILYLDKKTDIGVSENLFLYIELGDYYYLSDLTVEITSTEFDRVNSFSVYALRSTDIDYVDDIYYIYEFSGNDNNVLKLSSSDFVMRNPSYEEEVILDNIGDTAYYDVVDIINEYRYQDKLYYSYNIKREYVDGYYKNLDGYLRDDNDYKLYYRYRNRDRIDIANEIIIDDYNKKLDDFVSASTSYKMRGDIDYYKNGKYYVKYITDFVEVDKEVIVDIMDNDIRESLSSLMEEYDELKSEYQKVVDNYNSLFTQYNSKMNEIELLNNHQEYSASFYDSTVISDDYLDKIKKAEEERNACLLDLDNMRLRNDDNEKKLKLSDQVNEYLEHSLLNISKENKIENFNLIPFIIFGLLVLILVIIIIKKKLRKNKF